MRRCFSSSMKARFALLMLALFLPKVLEASSAGPSGPCKKNKLFKARRVVAWSSPSRVRNFFYESGMAIDADGAFRAYHPNDRLGLDSLAHAGHQGNWWALVTDNGKASGRPIVQGKS